MGIIINHERDYVLNETALFRQSLDRANAKFPKIRETVIKKVFLTYRLQNKSYYTSLENQIEKFLGQNFIDKYFYRVDRTIYGKDFGVPLLTFHVRREVLDKNFLYCKVSVMQDVSVKNNNNETKKKYKIGDAKLMNSYSIGMITKDKNGNNDSILSFSKDNNIKGNQIKSIIEKKIATVLSKQKS